MYLVNILYICTANNLNIAILYTITRGSVTCVHGADDLLRNDERIV